MSRRLVLVLAAAGAGQAAQYLARPMTSYRLLGLGHGASAVGLVAAAFAVLPLGLAIPLGRFASTPRRVGPMRMRASARKITSARRRFRQGSAPFINRNQSGLNALSDSALANRTPHHDRQALRKATSCGEAMTLAAGLAAGSLRCMKPCSASG